jgi:hypothetical protein
VVERSIAKTIRFEYLACVGGLVKGQDPFSSITVYLHSEIGVQISYISHFVGVTEVLLCASDQLLILTE